VRKTEKESARGIQNKTVETEKIDRDKIERELKRERERERELEQKIKREKDQEI
jgi:hypothetical protein